MHHKRGDNRQTIFLKMVLGGLLVLFFFIQSYGNAYSKDVERPSEFKNTTFKNYLDVIENKSKQNVAEANLELVETESWRYAQEQAAPGNNFAFDGYMRIDEGATAVSPIEQGLRYVTYNNQENLGGYEAALVMKKSGTNERYRVMYSSTWDEVLLWSSKGGILAVKPYNFEIGQTYRVLFAKQGNNLKVLINRATIIDMYDQTAPISVDSLAVATKEGKTYFGPLRVWEVGPPRIPSVPHQPQFSWRIWKGIPWGFDGDEPIFALPNNKALATEIKLVPGYAAQLSTSWYVQNWVDEAFQTDAVVSSTILEEGNRLKFTLFTKDTKTRPDITGEITVTVNYNAAKNVYEYDHISSFTIPTGKTLRMSGLLDVTDPIFNQIVPSASTQGPQWPVTHRYNVYQQLDGNYYKEPINHFAWYPGFGSMEWWNKQMNYMKPDGGTWTVVGDDIANPVLQWLEPSTRKEMSALMCWWGYDLHLNWAPGDGSATVLNPGTYTFNWRLTSASKVDADARLASSSYAFPGDLTEKWLVYTGGVGHVEKFDKTVVKASPFGEFVWGEGFLQDTTIGKNSSSSLRLDGPNFVQTTAGESQFTEGFEANTDYEISAWVKTENVQGEGPGIVFSGQPYYPGVTSTHDWQQIGFVARPQDPIHTVPFSLHNSGSGKVWFDNFQIRPITPGNPVTPGLNHPPKPLTTVGIVDSSKLLNWQTTGALNDDAKTVLDLSGHGNHAVRQNVSVTTTDGHIVFDFPGNNSQLLMRGHESVGLYSPATLVIWIKPGSGVNGWNVVASGGPAESDRWRLVLNKTDNYFIQAHLPTGIIGDVSNQVAENQWSQIVLVDDTSNVYLYLNGKLVGTKPSSSLLFGRGSKGYVRIGAMAFGGEIYAPYEGQISQVKILNTLLTAPEVMTEFGKGPFSP
jgi:hypothetical protein